MEQIRILLTLIIAAVAIHAQAYDRRHDDSKQMLDVVQRCDYFKYTYISPMMLQSFPEEARKTSELKNFPFEKISMIEIAKAQFGIKDFPTRVLVEDVVKLNKMELVSVNKQGDEGETAWYVTMDEADGREVIKKFLLVKFDRYFDGVTIIYIVGELGFDDVKKFL